MPWGEAIRLTRTLADDPASQIGAAVNDFDRPWSQEWAVVADLYDLTHKAAGAKNPKPYPRPWRDPNSRRRGRTNKSRAEVIAILNAHGHNIEAEVISHG